MSKASKALNSHREQSPEKLRELLAELNAELFDLRMRAFTDQERSPAQIRNHRRDIARVLTVLKEKEPAANP